MGIESGNFISALDRTNPLSSDPVSEGDDHLQLIKKVLQKTFPVGTSLTPDSGVGPGQAVQVLIAKSTAPTINGTAADSMGLLWLDISDTANPILKIRNYANDAWITLPIDPNANNTVDINAGTIDGTTVGASSASTGAFTTVTTTGALTVGADISISGDDIIMATNTDAYMLIADGTDYSPVAISGDVTITNAGVVTIGADKVTAPKISFIDDSLAVTDKHIMIADGTDYNNKILSGDVTMANTGAVTIADNAVTLAKQADGTQGGIIYYGGSGAPTELAAGAAGRVLSTAGAGANPSWVAESTIGGAIKVEELEDVSGTPSNDQYLKYSDSGSEWQMVNVVGDDKLSTKGDLLVYNTVDSETAYKIADSSYPGTDGYALTALAAADNGVAWQPVTVADNSVTLAKLEDGTQGDILYYGASGAPARLGFGTSGDVLTTGGTGANPAWATPTTGDITSVVAGSGLTGGATSGAATLTVGAGTGITVNTGDVQVATTYAGGTSIATVGTVGTGVWQGTAVAAGYVGSGVGKLATAAEWTKTQNFNSTELTFDATQDWDLSSNQVCFVTLTANTIFDAPSNQVDGAFYSITLIQDGTGGRTASWNSVFHFAGGTAPTLTTTASAVDILVFRSYNSTMLEVGRQLDLKTSA